MFTHLHLHSEYSLLDGLGHAKQLVQRAKELGMDTLALTDHGVLYGAVEFYLEARSAGLKPIIGCEAYMAVESRHQKTPADKNPYHLTILARDAQGYRNLLQLVTKAHTEGFYYRPRMDKELLEKHHAGLIALSGCPSGEVPRLILEGRMEEAERAARWYKDVFGDFYLEIQEHSIPELATINKGLVTLSRELDIPLVATNDVHYVYKADAPLQDILICIQTNTTVLDEKRMKMADDSFYLKSPQEMKELFPHIPEALENTQRIAERCDLSLDFQSLHLPRYKTPPGKSADEYLAELCWEGLRRRYPHISQELERRLSYELEVIGKTQFADYFLVVWDIIRFAKRNNILFGVRGSAAASLVLYCLGTTDIDPMAYSLVFERFLNLERKELPDIDLDFQDDRRDEVISYVAKEYGQDHVAHIITFGTLGARAAIRDVGRALGMTYADVDRVARLVPPTLNITLERAMESNPELKSIYREDPVVKKLVDTAMRLEGVARHASTHAAGLVISQEPLVDYVPLQRPTKGAEHGIAMTQFAMEPIAKLGLLKMDILGLANLTILSKSKEIVAQTRGIGIDLHQIPLNDAKTFELLSSGETTGIFQLESSGMRRYIKELKPSSLSDIAAMIALYRPGPMEQIDTFIAAKHGKAPIRYPHPALGGILKETYGVIVYQDQVLFILQTFAGYSLGQADVVRKAMGKKIPELMRQERERFLKGATEKGFPHELAERIYDLIEPFAGYAFNKAHSFSYAYIAYWTAYLKANYPAEYMTAVMTCHLGDMEKVAGAVAECHKLGIRVLLPDVNRSELDFSIEDMEDGKPAIRFGLAAIKNVGQMAVEPVVRARKSGGPFKSIEDFCRRANLSGINKRVLESIIKAGAMDSLDNRGSLLASADRILALTQREARLRDSGQSTMFDLLGEKVPIPLPTMELRGGGETPAERLGWEKELLGVYLSENPLAKLADRPPKGINAWCGQIDAEMAGQNLTVVGQVSSVRQAFTRNRRPFVSAKLEDLYGSVEVTAWPETYERTKELWVEGKTLILTGRVTVRENRVSLTADEVKPYEMPSGEAPWEESPSDEGIKPAERKNSSRSRTLRITLRETNNPERDEARLREVLGLLKEYSGKDQVHLVVAHGDGTTTLLEMSDIKTGYSSELHIKLTDILGQEDLEIGGNH